MAVDDESKVVIFKNSSDQVMYITNKLSDIQITDQIGNHSYLSFTMLKESPKFMADQTAQADMVVIYDERLSKKRRYKIKTIERYQESTKKFTETIEAESYNYAKYNNKYVSTTLYAGYTLANCLNTVLFRTNYFDYSANIGTIGNTTDGLTEDKTYNEQPLLDVLDELQKIFNCYLTITDDGIINYTTSIGKTADVLYFYGKNYTSLKEKIDKSEVIKRVVAKGKSTDGVSLTFSSINNSNDYWDDGDFSVGDNFAVLEESDETSAYNLLRKAKEKLNKNKTQLISYELTTSFIVKGSDSLINDDIDVGDTISISNPYFSNELITQKVIELDYNPFYPQKSPIISLGDKKQDLVEFLAGQTKEIAKLKRSATN